VNSPLVVTNLTSNAAGALSVSAEGVRSAGSNAGACAFVTGEFEKTIASAAAPKIDTAKNAARRFFIFPPNLNAEQIRRGKKRLDKKDKPIPTNARPEAAC
jgi:hypothetical protein